MSFSLHQPTQIFTDITIKIPHGLGLWSRRTDTVQLQNLFFEPENLNGAGTRWSIVSGF
jgi:hypothetical protein